MLEEGDTFLGVYRLVLIRQILGDRGSLWRDRQIYADLISVWSLPSQLCAFDWVFVGRRDAILALLRYNFTAALQNLDLYISGINTFPNIFVTFWGVLRRLERLGDLKLAKVC